MIQRVIKVGLAVSMLSLLGGCFGHQKNESGYKGYETPRYDVKSREDQFELREYKPALMAEVRVDGDRGEAVSKGFRILAAYIFGDNEPAAKVSMTSPVTQTKTTIAMTSPVTQSQVGEEWLVQFMMPSAYTLETLPKTKDSRIRFYNTKPVRKAVVMFSGFTNDGAVATQTQKLSAWVAEKKLVASGAPVIAYYDDPFTLPWNRRNEVQLVVK